MGWTVLFPCKVLQESKIKCVTYRMTDALVLRERHRERVADCRIVCMRTPPADPQTTVQGWRRYRGCGRGRSRDSDRARGHPVYLSSPPPSPFASATATAAAFASDARPPACLASTDRAPATLREEGMGGRVDQEVKHVHRARLRGTGYQRGWYHMWGRVGYEVLVSVRYDYVPVTTT